MSRVHVAPFGAVRGWRWHVRRDGSKRALRSFPEGAMGKGEALALAIETAGPGGQVIVHDRFGDVDTWLQLK